MIRQALQGEPLITSEPAPEVLLVDFAASAITYRVRVWTTDFAADERVRDRVRSRIYYAFRRHGISIPYPIQVQMDADRAGVAPPTRQPGAAAFDGVDILAAADRRAARRAAPAASRSLLYAAGRGDRDARATHGDSMFVLARGEAVGDAVADRRRRWRRCATGAFFGEMSLLTGDRAGDGHRGDRLRAD